MKVLGIITEYNPFHNGHLYHLKQAKKESGCDCVVCVMSGNFVQRGEPALVNKWARTKMALLSGVDLVIELPFPYAAQSAEFFAYGSISILDGISVVDVLCFGSELGRIDELQHIADYLAVEPEEYTLCLKDQLLTGAPFPAAREKALAVCLGDAIEEETLSSLLSSSNNILAIEYLKMIKRLGSSIRPLTIRRIKAPYRSENIFGTIASATAIRKNISEGQLTDPVIQALPEVTTRILSEEFREGRGPIFAENFEKILLYHLRSLSREELSRLPDVSEGLENRIKEAAEQTGSLEEMIKSIKTKRYTRTRIQRILMNALIGLEASEVAVFNRKGGPRYARILGFTDTGRSLLSEIKRKSRLPILTKAADARNSGDPSLKRMLDLEARSTDIYCLGCPNPAYRSTGQEFTNQLVIV